MDLGKILIYFGILLVIVGLILTVFPKITTVWKIPGDIYFKRGDFSFYFPIVTCIILSLLLMIVFNFFSSGK